MRRWWGSKFQINTTYLLRVYNILEALIDIERHRLCLQRGHSQVIEINVKVNSSDKSQTVLGVIIGNQSWDVSNLNILSHSSCIFILDLHVLILPSSLFPFLFFPAFLLLSFPLSFPLLPFLFFQLFNIINMNPIFIQNSFPNCHSIFSRFL